MVENGESKFWIEHLKVTLNSVVAELKVVSGNYSALLKDFAVWKKELEIENKNIGKRMDSLERNHKECSEKVNKQFVDIDKNKSILFKAFENPFVSKAITTVIVIIAVIIINKIFAGQGLSPEDLKSIHNILSSQGYSLPTPLP